MTGVAFTHLTDTQETARRLVTLAGERCEGRPIWALLAGGGRHELEALVACVQTELGEVPLYGGACVGAIGDDGVGYSGYECALALFEERHGVPSVITVSPIEEREFEAGQELARELAGCTGPEDSVLLFYDTVRVSGEGLNVGSEMLDGLYQTLPVERAPTIMGAGLIGDFQCRTGGLVVGGEARRDAAMALVLPRGLRMSLKIMHGLRPVSRRMEITRAEGCRILELDGRPALETLRSLLGGGGSGEDVAIAFSLLLGCNHGDPFGGFEEEAYVNRLIIGVDESDGSLSLFESDLVEGDRVQLMLRDNRTMYRSVEEGAAELLAGGRGRPVMAFYVDCAGRAAPFTGSDRDESELVRQAMHGQMPLFGLYVGREIGPSLGRSRPHDWTGVLALLDEVD